MATTIKGTSPCPECGSTQSVKSDGRKYFIHCTECKTFTHYQNKDAKKRIEAKIIPIEAPETPPETNKTKTEQAPVKPKLTPTPASVSKSGGVFDLLDDLLL